MNMQTNTEQLRRALDGVAKLLAMRGLLLRSSKHYCQVINNGRSGVHAALGDPHHFKSLRPQCVESVILVSAYILNESCHHTVFPLRQTSRRPLRGDCGRIRASENPLRQGTKISAVYDRAESNAGNEDHGERDEPFGS